MKRGIGEQVVPLTAKQLETLRWLADTDWLIAGHSINTTVAAKLYALGLVDRRVFRPEDYAGGWGVPTCYRITQRGREVVGQRQ